VFNSLARVFFWPGSSGFLDVYRGLSQYILGRCGRAGSCVTSSNPTRSFERKQKQLQLARALQAGVIRKLPKPPGSEPTRCASKAVVGGCEEHSPWRSLQYCHLQSLAWIWSQRTKRIMERYIEVLSCLARDPLPSVLELLLHLVVFYFSEEFFFYYSHVPLPSLHWCFRLL